MDQETSMIAKSDKKTVNISVKTLIIVGVIMIIGILANYSKSFFIAALVDGSPISRFSVIQRLEKVSGKNVLDSLTTEILIKNAASVNNIVISDNEISEKIQQIENQVVAQGNTLEKALALEGMSMGDLKKQIMFQKEIEKLLADKIMVTDEEITKYIEDYKISVPKDQNEQIMEQIKSELQNQKLNKEAQAMIAELKAKANIHYFVNY